MLQYSLRNYIRISRIVLFHHMSHPFAEPAFLKPGREFSCFLEFLAALLGLAVREGMGEGRGLGWGTDLLLS